MDESLDFAVGLAREAGEIMRQNFALGMKKEWKEDNSPITAIDIKINTLVLDAIQKKYPTHSFVGEEGSRIVESEYTWVCDPIDGTIPFSHGYPTFAFSLALVRNGEPILGVIYDPIMDRLLWAEKSTGAFLTGEKISVSSEKDFSGKYFVESNNLPKTAALREMLAERGAWIPTLYSCVYAGILVATGEFTASVYPYDKPWDAAAVK